ncbi:hypothetical protein CASFOL_024070 [Castilleja foliolosa]|uniref:Uncharacterized protein n=1 Tax=Castilleja foliolosa TaxID=1961234 RepID=A0ABD3CMA5_9LAMI
MIRGFTSSDQFELQKGLSPVTNILKNERRDYEAFCLDEARRAASNFYES